jgi:hypothetical protein
LTDVEKHASRVDVLDAKAADLAEAKTGRVEDGQEDAVAECLNGGENREQLVDREHNGKVLLAAAEGNASDQLRTIHHVEIEEAKGTDGLIEQTPGDLPGVPEEEEILLDLGEPK